MVFTSVKHTSCWCRDKCPTPLSHPPAHHPSSPFSRSNFVCYHSHLSSRSTHLSRFSLFFSLTPVPFFFWVHRSAFAPFLSLSLLPSCSLDPLKSAHTCCHIPPVQFSDRTAVKWTTLTLMGQHWAAPAWMRMDRSRTGWGGGGIAQRWIQLLSTLVAQVPANILWTWLCKAVLWIWLLLIICFYTNVLVCNVSTCSVSYYLSQWDKMTIKALNLILVLSLFLNTNIKI